MFYLNRILFVFVTLRMLMPPGICACKLNSPAVRYLATFLRADEQPLPPLDDGREDDDHAPGCPASFLATGMGVKPPVDSPLPFPVPSLDQPLVFVPAEVASEPSRDVAKTLPFEPDRSLYLTLCALLI